MTFRPMLAAPVKPEQLSKLRYPMIGSPKLDGIRCVLHEGRALTRSLKPIPNKYTFAKLNDIAHLKLDGELIVGEPTAPDVYLRTNSAIMSHEGEPDFRFYAFDCLYETEQPYFLRFMSAHLLHGGHVIRHEHKTLNNADDVLAYEQQLIDAGYEGLILRAGDVPYKFNRSTLKEQGMLKMKRFTDAEAVIIDAFPLEKNTNEQVRDERGYAERSESQDGKVAQDTLGSIRCRTPEGIEFNIGGGPALTAERRKELWELHKQEALVGLIAKYKFFPVGVKEAPRHPNLLGLRDPSDM